MGCILKPLAHSSLLFTRKEKQQPEPHKPTHTHTKQKSSKQKTKTHHENKTLIEVNGMFTGAKTAKDLRTGEMQVNMKLAKWYFKGLWYIYIHCMQYSMYKSLFQFLQPKIVCRRETADNSEGISGFSSSHLFVL